MRRHERRPIRGERDASRGHGRPKSGRRTHVRAFEEVRTRLVVGSWAWQLLLPALLLFLAGAPAHAQTERNTAGLVILDEAGGIGYGLVTFDEDEISGMDLLRRSGAEPVTVSFGGLGDGVCGIGRTGCSIDVCRKRMCQTGSADSPFWQTFAIGDDGTWASLQLGASADRVSDGEVRLWAWTGTTPDLPAVSLSDISTKVSDRRDQIIWEGSNPTSNGTGSSLWLGLALVGGVSIVAAVVTMRARSQHG